MTLTTDGAAAYPNGQPVDKADVRALWAEADSAITAEATTRAADDTGLRNAVRDGAILALTNVAGTGNAITADLSPAAISAGITTLSTNTALDLKPTATNTAANPTLTVAGTSYGIRDADGGAWPASAFVPGRSYLLRRQGTILRIISGDLTGAELTELRDVVVAADTGLRNAVRDGAIIALTNVAGTGNAITADLSASATSAGITGLGTNTALDLRPVATNSAINPTLTVAGATYAIRDADGGAWPANGFVPGRSYLLRRAASVLRVIAGDLTRQDFDTTVVSLGGQATPVYASRASAVSAAPGLPASLTHIMVREGNALVIRSRTASADDPLFGTGDRWGVVFRTLGIVEIEALISAATGDTRTELRRDVSDARAVATLAEQRAQVAEATATINQSQIAATKAEMRAADVDNQMLATLAEQRAQAAGASTAINQSQIAALLARIESLEQERDAQMTTYTLSLTAGTTSQVAVAAGPVQRLQLLNKSATETVGVAFGTAPANMAAQGLVTLAPGAALDTTLIQTTPVYVIATGTAEVVGAFAMPLGEPNPNWETDLQALFTRMGSTPSLLWQRAYRRLYSALRREGILSITRGFYPIAAHAQAAALINWAEDNTATIVGYPVFTAGQGFAFDGVNDYLDTARTLGVWTNYNDVAVVVWPDKTIQGVGPAAMGDGVFLLHPNRTADEGAIKGFHSQTAADVVSNPAGAMLGGMRLRAADFTAFRPGGNDLLLPRENVAVTYPARRTFIGASNGTSGVIAGSFYTGTIKGAWFGRALNAVQRLTLETAMDQYFKDAARAVAV